MAGPEEKFEKVIDLAYTTLVQWRPAWLCGAYSVNSSLLAADYSVNSSLIAADYCIAVCQLLS